MEARMTSKQFALSDLEIVAYADKLLPEHMPAILPPIFKVKDHDVLIFPPFHIDGAYVYSDAIGDTAELHRQIAADQATLLSISREASPNHELWIDVDQSIHYEHWDEVEQQHQRKARELSSEARQFFYQGAFGQSKRLCQLAIRYYEGFIDPYIVLMAMAKVEKKELVEKMYAQAIEDFLGVELYSELSHKLCNEYSGKSANSNPVPRFFHTRTRDRV
jgi:hypothetical protein